MPQRSATRAFGRGTHYKTASKERRDFAAIGGQPTRRADGRNNMRLWIVLLVVFAGGVARAEHHVVERVAAVVNDQVILESELHARMLPLLPSIDQIADPTERARRTNTLTNK